MNDIRLNSNDLIDLEKSTSTLMDTIEEINSVLDAVKGELETKYNGKSISAVTDNVQLLSEYFNTSNEELYGLFTDTSKLDGLLYDKLQPVDGSVDCVVQYYSDLKSSFKKFDREWDSNNTAVCSGSVGSTHLSSMGNSDTDVKRRQLHDLDSAITEGVNQYMNTNYNINISNAIDIINTILDNVEIQCEAINDITLTYDEKDVEDSINEAPKQLHDLDTLKTNAMEFFTMDEPTYNELMLFYMDLKAQGYDGYFLDTRFFGILSSPQYYVELDIDGDDHLDGVYKEDWKQVYFRGSYDEEYLEFKDNYPTLDAWLLKNECYFDFGHMATNFATYSVDQSSDQQVITMGSETVTIDYHTSAPQTAWLDSNFNGAWGDNISEWASIRNTNRNGPEDMRTDQLVQDVIENEDGSLIEALMYEIESGGVTREEYGYE